MDSNDNKTVDHLPNLTLKVSPKDLYDLEKYFLNMGRSVFLYDEKLDVFRFEEDGRFALCEEFADWTLLKERGYLKF